MIKIWADDDTAIESGYKSAGVWLVFTVLFATLLSLLTKARRHEIFACTAAYAAVLVIFVQNGNTTVTKNSST